MGEFMEILQNFGFPVACVAVLFIMLYTEMKARRESDEKWAALTAECKAAVESCRAAVESLKMMVQHLHGVTND